MSFDSYRNRVTRNGSTLQDANRIATKISMLNSFYDSPSYYQVYINNSLTPSDVWITDNSTTKENKLLVMKPGESISNGDLVKWKSDYWLTLITDDMGGVYQRGTIQLCNHTLKWQHDYQTISYPCVVTNSSSGGDGTNPDRYMVLPVGNFNVYLPDNVDTRNLTIDQRFIIQGEAWKVVFVDKISTKGIITLTVEKSALSPNDRLDLGIADYQEGVYTIDITNLDTISTVGDTLQLNVNVTLNGTPVASPTITYTSSDDTIATVDANGLVTCVSVGIANIITESNGVSDSIQMDVQSVPVSQPYSMVITTTSTPIDQLKNSQTKTYTVSVYQGSTLVTTEPVTWQIFADDQVSSTTLATITSQNGTSCVLKGNANSGYVQLKATLVSDSSVVAWYRIQMKAIW